MPFHRYPGFSQRLQILLEPQFDLVITNFPYQAWILVPLIKYFGTPLVHYTRRPGCKGTNG